MSDDPVYNGSCFCGAVQFTVSGAPELMGYCHCNSCRHWSAGPVNAFTLWRPTAVTVTKGGDNIESFDENPGTDDENHLQHPQMVQILWRTYPLGASRNGINRRLCGP